MFTTDEKSGKQESKDTIPLRGSKVKPAILLHLLSVTK
jgi:hypothetical protein